MRLWSRNGRDWSVEFVAITSAIMALPVTRIVLDGEAVAHCPKGLPDFDALLRMRDRPPAPRREGSAAPRAPSAAPQAPEEAAPALLYS